MSIASSLAAACTYRHPGMKHGRLLNMITKDAPISKLHRLFAFQFVRWTSSSPIHKETEDPNAMMTDSQAKLKAQKLLEFFPGNTMFTKTAVVTGFIGLFAFLEAKGLYIVNSETTCAVAFFTLMRLFYIYLGPTVNEFCANGIAEYRQIWTNKFESHKKKFRDQFSHLERFNEIKTAINEYIRIKKENVMFEQELDQLHQINKHLASVKTQLDDRVRKVFEERENEKRELLARLKEKVFQDLKDSKTQDTIMKQCLADIESIGVNKI